VTTKPTPKRCLLCGEEEKIINAPMVTVSLVKDAGAADYRSRKRHVVGEVCQFCLASMHIDVSDDRQGAMR
jgi:hypothetical protein